MNGGHKNQMDTASWVILTTISFVFFFVCRHNLKYLFFLENFFLYFWSAPTKSQGTSTIQMKSRNFSRYFFCLTTGLKEHPKNSVVSALLCVHNIENVIRIEFFFCCESKTIFFCLKKKVRELVQLGFLWWNAHFCSNYVVCTQKFEKELSAHTKCFLDFSYICGMCAHNIFLERIEQEHKSEVFFSLSTTYEWDSSPSPTHVFVCTKKTHEPKPCCRSKVQLYLCTHIQKSNTSWKFSLFLYQHKNICWLHFSFAPSVLSVDTRVHHINFFLWTQFFF